MPKPKRYGDGTPTTEVHPLRKIPGETMKQELERLRELTAQLWDQVWWLSLKSAQRKKYQAKGYTDPFVELGHKPPITRFYE